MSIADCHDVDMTDLAIYGLARQSSMARREYPTCLVTTVMPGTTWLIGQGIVSVEDPSICHTQQDIATTLSCLIT